METYNGYKNYKTWLVALWLTNEREYYEQVLEILESHKDEPRFVLEDKIKEFVEDIIRLHELPLLAQDLIRSTLSDVDWREVYELHFEALEFKL